MIYVYNLCVYKNHNSLQSLIFFSPERERDFNFKNQSTCIELTISSNCKSDSHSTFYFCRVENFSRYNRIVSMRQFLTKNENLCS